MAEAWGCDSENCLFHSYNITAANVHDICNLNDVKLEM